MEPAPQQTPESAVQNTTPPAQPVPKKSGGLIIFLSIALILVSTLAGFFAWQNQKLTKLLREQITKVQPTPTPLPAEVLTKEGDPTANWKTYSNYKIGVSFQYPSIWSFSENATKISVDFSTMILSSVLSEGSLKLEYIMNVQLENPDNFAQWSKDTAFTKSLGTETINGLVFEKYSVPDMKLSLNYIHKRPNGDIIRIYIFPYDDEADFNQKLKPTFDQILSTFKFIGPSQTPTI